MLSNSQSLSHGHDSDSAGHRRILVIEDDPDQQFLLKDLITILGYDVKSAPNALTGIRLAKSFNPDVILCDIGLPDLSGYDLLRMLRSDSRFQDTFIIAMSGYGQASVDENGQPGAFDRHLVKPVELETLDRLLADATARPSAKTAKPKNVRTGQIGGPGIQAI